MQIAPLHLSIHARIFLKMGHVPFSENSIILFMLTQSVRMEIIMNTYGFIGCGNMGGILATSAAKDFGSSVYLYDPDTKKAQAIADKTGARIVDVETLSENCDYIFLGVKPQVLPSVLTELKPLLSRRTVLVSMAAGVCIEKIKSIIPDQPVIRIMPNTPAKVGQGVILYSAAGDVTQTEIEGFLDALQSAGTLDTIDEKQIDAASALSGCGPAFVYMFIEALADGAVKCGLPRDKALVYAAGTVMGAGKMVLEGKAHPEALKDAVCSPGGSTIAGVAALEEKAFRGAVISAVTAAYKRTKELG